MNQSEVLALYDRYCGKIKSTGSNQYVAQCPFPDHPDKVQSFSFNTMTSQYNCFGCNEKGNAVTFAKLMGDDPKNNFFQDTLVSSCRSTIKSSRLLS